MTDTVQQGAATLLRMRQVKVRTGLSRSTIYLKIKAGEFPAQVSWDRARWAGSRLKSTAGSRAALRAAGAGARRWRPRGAAGSRSARASKPRSATSRPMTGTLWLRIGMAIKSALGEAGFALWDDWSRSSERYREADARTVWRSIDAEGGVTIATLFFEAAKYGYVRERPARPITWPAFRPDRYRGAPR